MGTTTYKNSPTRKIERGDVGGPQGPATLTSPFSSMTPATNGTKVCVCVWPEEREHRETKFTSEENGFVFGPGSLRTTPSEPQAPQEQNKARSFPVTYPRKSGTRTPFASAEGVPPGSRSRPGRFSPSGLAPHQQSRPSKKRDPTSSRGAQRDEGRERSYQTQTEAMDAKSDAKGAK